MKASHLSYITDNTFDLKKEERVVGSYLYDKFQQMVGRIQGLLVDTGAFEVRYAVLIEGGFLYTEGKTVLLPRPLYEVIDMGKVKAQWSQESLQQAPSIDDVRAVTRNEETALLGYYDLKPYWEEETPEEGDD